MYAYIATETTQFSTGRPKKRGGKNAGERITNSVYEDKKENPKQNNKEI